MTIRTPHQLMICSCYIELKKCLEADVGDATQHADLQAFLSCVAEAGRYNMLATCRRSLCYSDLPVRRDEGSVRKGPFRPAVTDPSAWLRTGSAGLVTCVWVTGYGKVKRL